MTTHVLMVIDASGSMAKLAEDVRGGHNQMLDKLQKNDGDYRITVVTFNYKVTSLCEAVPLAKAPRLDDDNYQPFGSTALLAAVGTAIDNFEDIVPVILDGDRAMLVIQTDGLENFSHMVHGGYYTWDKVSKMLSAREKKGWSIQYIGATADAWDQGVRLGVSSQSVHRSTYSSAGTQAVYHSVTRGVQAYASGATAQEVSGIVATGLATDDE